MYFFLSAREDAVTVTVWSRKYYVNGLFHLENILQLRCASQPDKSFNENLLDERCIYW